AQAILQRAMALDPTLEELTTITAAFVDLIEEGLSREEALAKIQATIIADPTLQNFDDLIAIQEEEEKEVEVKEEEEEEEEKEEKEEQEQGQE
ncbi:hypothetical protein LM597_03160, partial [Candidatus Acetothermia bacterium]|nr:hypothetical protein [Candidatus Acetothermia bacterium]